MQQKKWSALCDFARIAQICLAILLLMGSTFLICLTLFSLIPASWVANWILMLITLIGALELIINHCEYKKS